MVGKEDEALAIRIAREKYFSNPFWSDPTDPADDWSILFAVGEYRNSQLRYRIDGKKRAVRQVVKSLVSFVLAVLLVLLYFGVRLTWGQETHQKLLGVTLFFSVQSFGLSLIFLGNFRGVVSAAFATAFAPYRRALKQVGQESQRRYEAYLQGLSTSDPGLYASVQLWHQQQEALRLSRVAVQQQARIIQQNSAILRASQRTADELAQARLRDQNRLK